jgi:aminopeptidase YwaD
MKRCRSFYVILLFWIVIGSACSPTGASNSENASKVEEKEKASNVEKVEKEEKDSSKTSVKDNSMIKSIIPMGEEVNADSMYEMVRYLSEKPREAGTEGEKRAVDYIESQFKSLGYETELQPIPLVDYKEKKRELKIDNKILEGDIKAFLGSHVSGEVSAELVDVGKAYYGEVGDEVKGKIALIETGSLPYFEQIETVLRKGAIGAIMYSNMPSGSFDVYVNEGVKIPGVTITRDQGLEIAEQLEKGLVNATLDVEVETIKSSSYNVIATKKPNDNNDTGQIVTVGAHHDSVPGGPGANDDASGVSAVLELARIFSEKSIDTEIRFITFGAEEIGLVGSSLYVNSLSIEEKFNIVSHLQLDMVGAAAAGGEHPGGGLMMYTLDGRPNIVTDLAATASIDVFSEAIPYGESGRSDHEPFHRSEIPAALFIHTPLEPDYHQTSDTIDKISKEKLKQVTEIVGSAVNTIVSPDTPKITRKGAIPATVEYQYEEREL